VKKGKLLGEASMQRRKGTCLVKLVCSEERTDVLQDNVQGKGIFFGKTGLMCSGEGKLLGNTGLICAVR